MNSKYPKEWRLTTLGSISERVQTKNNQSSVNVLTISAEHGLISQTQFFNKVVASKNLDDYTLLKKGDFAYNKSYSKGYPIGAVRSLKKYEVGVVSPLYICFRLNSSTIEKMFAEYYFYSDRFINEIRAIAQEGARNHGLLNVAIPEFFSAAFPIPPLAEQKKIAEILSSVDEVIENTESEISKLEDLKKATLNELLTKGIGHTEFKESEVGRIPKSWRVISLEDCGRWRGGGTPSKERKEFWENGTIPWVSPKDMKSAMLDRSEDFITADALRASTTQLIKDGSLLVVFRSGILRHSLPVAENTVSVAINQDMKALECVNGIKATFLRYVIERNAGAILQQCSKVGTTVESLDWDSFRKFLLALPSGVEQEKICQLGNALEACIGDRKYALESHRLLRKSLMQDLLTGKVRVKVN